MSIRSVQLRKYRGSEDCEISFFRFHGTSKCECSAFFLAVIFDPLQQSGLGWPMKIARNLSMGSPFFAVFQKGVRPEISASAFPCDEPPGDVR